MAGGETIGIDGAEVGEVLVDGLGWFRNIVTTVDEAAGDHGCAIGGDKGDQIDRGDRPDLVGEREGIHALVITSAAIGIGGEPQVDLAPLGGGEFAEVVTVDHQIPGGLAFESDDMDEEVLVAVVPDGPSGVAGGETIGINGTEVGEVLVDGLGWIDPSTVLTIGAGAQQGAA